MSIDDPLILHYYENRDTWILKRGNETFYDTDRSMREWDTPEEAIEWAESHLGETPQKKDD